jgi:Flp pilus assembly protein TadG
MTANRFSGILARLAWRAVGPISRDRRGNVAMMFALTAVPLIALMGLGIDYYRDLSNKARLDAAADAAALSAISTAQAYINANSASQVDPTLTANAIAAGKAQAAKAFAANAGTVELAAPTTPQITLARPPHTQTFNATVAYSAQIPTAFGGLVGVNTLNITGSSGSSLTMGKYLDFYLVLDVSGSMGIPTATDGQNALAQSNPDNAQYTFTYPTGCNFACHFSGNSGFTWTRSHLSTMSLRVDTVGAAVQSLLQTATQTETLANQYRIGIYPFIVHAIQAAPLSANFTTANTVAGNFANYLDQGTTNGGMGSGGTHFENLWSDMQPYLQTVGTGASASSPQPFIFLVTDGADNNQVYTPSTGSWTGSQPQLPSQTFCTNAKNAGYTVAVLYIPYVAIIKPNPNFANDEDDKVNAIIPSIQGVLGGVEGIQGCASPGFFFTADPAADSKTAAAAINNAVQAMFVMALQQARLTN